MPGRFLQGLLLLLLAGGPVRAQRPPGQAVGPLPPAVAALLDPARRGAFAADIQRQRAAQAQWRGDSLSELLIYSRLAQDYRSLAVADSLYRYLWLAWRRASPAQRRRQPAEAIKVAQNLAYYQYNYGAADSTRYYFQQALALFQAARLDSLRAPNVLLPTGELWTGASELPAMLAHAGSASRSLGNLPEALRYYERALARWQAQHQPNGISWAQSLIGETYVEQDNLPQALRVYEQALGTARAYRRQNPSDGTRVLADVLLNYYAPLLLQLPDRAAYLGQLATETEQALLALATHPSQQTQAADSLFLARQLARVNLLPAQAALQAGQPAAAAPWLVRARHWLAAGIRPGTAGHDLDYEEVRASFLGLQAWQQHAADPAEARHLLDEATALLTWGGPGDLRRRPRQQLATYCLAMHEPARAVQLLRPLRRIYQRSGSTWPLSQVTGLLTQAYAQAGRYDSAYYYSRRTQVLTDSVREARQFAALAATEARYRTREQAGQIQLLTRLSAQQTRYVRLAGAGALLLAVLALGLGVAWRTTRRLNQQLAAQATQLGELDEAKNQFFANVSHELRTPLTLVLGPLGTLLTDPAHALPATVRQPVALAHRQAQRLLQLVNRILDLTKLQAGRLALRPVPTPLAPWLRRVVGQFESLATQRGLALHGPAALPTDEWHVLVDADKLEEILTNLLINALNHTPPGGVVRVGLTRPAAGDDFYSLTVADTGPGIAPAEQARVFERFYQSPQTHAQGGTGLGLALSRELATLLGGTLTLASDPGRGAAFTLRFPAVELRVEREEVRVEQGEMNLKQDATPAANPPPTLHSSLSIPNSKPRVLVVEDQPDLREYLHSLLAPTCEVLLAADGQAALELLGRAAPVDLITTDAMMPRLSGIELLGRLRATPALAGVPVLMLTARADEAHRLTALTVGVDDYLTKPFTPAELQVRVQALLARQQVRRHFAALPPQPAPAPTDHPADLPDERPPSLTAEVAVRRRPARPEAGARQLAQWQALVQPQLASEAFGPPELAELLCLSERTLYRRLGELAGLTPAAWLRELRLNQARCLLEAGEAGSVVEVAEAVGFGNARYFTKLYTERFGRHPADYLA